jgi:hypothetical protein
LRNNFNKINEKKEEGSVATTIVFGSPGFTIANEQLKSIKS